MGGAPTLVCLVPGPRTAPWLEEFDAQSWHHFESSFGVLNPGLDFRPMRSWTLDFWALFWSYMDRDVPLGAMLGVMFSRILHLIPSGS